MQSMVSEVVALNLIKNKMDTWLMILSYLKMFTYRVCFLFLQYSIIYFLCIFKTEKKMHTINKLIEREHI